MYPIVELFSHYRRTILFDVAKLCMHICIMTYVYSCTMKYIQLYVYACMCACKSHKATNISLAQVLCV